MFEDLILPVLLVVGGLLALALVGAVVSLAVLIPPLRRLG